MTTLSKIKYFLVAIFSCLVISAAPAFAGTSPTTTRPNEPKLRACDAREQVVKTRMNNLLRMSNNMVEVFDKISLRVQEYYQNKVVPSGKTVSNYDTLIAAIASKKDAVKMALDKANTDSLVFNCDTERPKSTLVIFRQDMQSVKNALRDYRISIKNLIAAVRSVVPKPTEAMAN